MKEKMYKPTRYRDTAYIAHKDGNIFSEYKDRFIKPIISAKYLRFTLVHKGIKKTCTVHRIIAECFIPNPENKPCVNHKDGNRLNNNSENLEWVTYKENIVHASCMGLLKTPHAKLTKIDVENVRRLLFMGAKQKDIAESMNVSKHVINRVNTGKSYKTLS
jgi:hypothetical protein